MRLVDADALIEVIKESRPLNWTDSDSELQEDADYNHFIEIINAQPTAYDIEKVVAELEEAREIREWRRAEEQGLLLRLPCKVGDTVYTACSWGIESGKVGSIEIMSDMIFVNNIHHAMIGEARNIFLTREKAERALEMQKGK